MKKNLENTTSKFFLVLLALIASAGVFLLAGCGGGGGGSEPPGESSAVAPAVNSSGLPPDPGAAGKATIAGIDSDGDGVGDDLQRYIAQTYPDSEKKRKALEQYAKVVQQSLLDADNKELSMRHAEEEDREVACMQYLFSFKEYLDMSDNLIAYTLNSDMRSRAYLRYDAHFGDEVFSEFPSVLSACGFDPATLAN